MLTCSLEYGVYTSINDMISKYQIFALTYNYYTMTIAIKSIEVIWYSCKVKLNPKLWRQKSLSHAHSSPYTFFYHTNEKKKNWFHKTNYPITFKLLNLSEI